VQWDLNTGERRATWSTGVEQQEIRAIAVSANGKYALTGSENQLVQLWEIKTGKVAITLESAPK
jgi:WD40 repeat protein